MLKSRKRGCALCNEMDELQVAVSKELLDIKKFYPQEGDDKIHQAVIDEIIEETKNPLLDQQEIDSLLKSIKKLPLPHEVRANQYVHDNNLTCDVGHKDDYFYITEENIAIEAFRAGIKQATDQFKLRVDLGIAWNTGANWLIFWPRLVVIQACNRGVSVNPKFNFN